MKQLLRGRFLPPDYEQYMFKPYQRCAQGMRNVNEYASEFMRLAERNQLSESDNQQIARYLNGLKPNIRDKIGIQMVLSEQETRNLALKVELMLSEKAHNDNYCQYSGNENKQVVFDRGKSVQGAQPSNPLHIVNPDKATTRGNIRGTTFNLLKSSNPYANPILLKCFKCNEVGHRSSDYLRRKTVNIVEREEEDVVDEEVYCGLDGKDDEDEYDHEVYTCVVRNLMLSQKNKDTTQQHNLFRTRCTVKGKI